MATKRIVGWHADMGRKLRGMTPQRDDWGAIKAWYSSESAPTVDASPGFPKMGRTKLVYAREVLGFFAEALPEEYIEFDKKNRGDCLNVALYAYAPSERVAIVQARHAFRRHRNGYLNVHKTYFLTGHNEITKRPFRHPISASVVKAAVRKHGADQVAIVRACQAWMWQVTDRQLSASIRQGDVLITPVRGAPAGESLGTTVALDSHVIEASEVRRNGALFARDLTIRHEKRQHRDVLASGWHRITQAREGRAWDFAARLGD
jgi:hypothetical protein